jgi:ATP/maltotriose-dependent transcriptional regulator MalT
MVMNENQRLREVIQQKEKALKTTTITKEPAMLNTVSPEAIELFTCGLEKLTAQERQIYKAYLNKMSTKDIMNELNIKENTLKFHNKNLYSKLGVSSRKQLLEVYKTIREYNQMNID